LSLSTHVLDTAQGKPAAGMRFSLYLVGGLERTFMDDYTANADGRTDGPLFADDQGNGGTWELVFAVGEYFSTQTVVQDDPPFLDEVVIRFTMKAGSQHYHVPLLISPWAYSTYRGS